MTIEIMLAVGGAACVVSLQIWAFRASPKWPGNVQDSERMASRASPGPSVYRRRLVISYTVGLVFAAAWIIHGQILKHRATEELNRLMENAHGRQK